MPCTVNCSSSHFYMNKLIPWTVLHCRNLMQFAEIYDIHEILVYVLQNITEGLSGEGVVKWNMADDNVCVRPVDMLKQLIEGMNIIIPMVPILMSRGRGKSCW